jgi:glycosyltransferase involved in cell wall biosynthesis
MRIVRYYPRALTGDGGMTAAVRHWSRGFVHAGTGATIVFHEGEPPATDDGVQWIRAQHRGPGPFLYPVGLDEVLREGDVLVLHSAWAYHNVRAASVARRLGVPYVLEPRGAYDPRIVRRKRLLKRAWWSIWERELVQRASAIHVFFEDERPHLEALGYRGPVIAAPNGVEPPPGINWDGGSGGYVLWLGRFDPEHKGIDMLVEAVSVLEAEQRPRVRLCGPDSRARGKDSIRHMVRSLGLEPWISVEEPVHGRAKFELMSRAIGFVYPSRWEGFGNSVAEAIAVGVPTVVTPYPFGRHLARRGAAILAQPTPHGLAEGLRALRSPEAAAIGARGATVAREDLAWDSVARSWLTQVAPLV